MSAAIVAKLAIPLLLEALREGLSRVDHPAAQEAKGAIESVQGALAGGQIAPEQLFEANRHVEKMAELQMQERIGAVGEVNESLRAEVASSDPYVRRMRPTFGYLMAATWAAQMLALAWVIVASPAQAALVLQAMESLGTIWAVALSVLGIYVYQRSSEKKAGALAPPTAPIVGTGIRTPVIPKYNE